MTPALGPADLPRWANVRLALTGFRTYLSPQIPLFQIMFVNDSWWDDQEYKRLRPAGFPSRIRGVYLIFDDEDRLLYVGVTSVNFDKRVWCQDNKIEAKGYERRWTDVIVLPREFFFLGPSLECFLICRLKPLCNTAYKGYEIPILE